MTTTTRPVRSGIWSTLNLDLGGNICTTAGSRFLKSDQALPILKSQWFPAEALWQTIDEEEVVGLWLRGWFPLYLTLLMPEDASSRLWMPD